MMLQLPSCMKLFISVHGFGGDADSWGPLIKNQIKSGCCQFSSLCALLRGYAATCWTGVHSTSPGPVCLRTWLAGEDLIYFSLTLPCDHILQPHR